MKTLLCVLFFSALTMRAADLTGKWSGSFDITNSNGETKADTAYLDLKEQGGEVTGTAGPNADKQWKVVKGKLDGKKLNFEVDADEGGVLIFNLTFDGEEITGDCSGTGDGGEKMTAKVKVKRVTT